jgi:hypothetical protein
MPLTLDQGVKLVETAAIIVCGLWTVWRFNKLQEARTAELENQARLNDLLSKQPNLSVGITVTETAWAEESTRGFLSVFVTLKNEGDQNANVWFQEGALTVGRIVLDKSGRQSVKEVRRIPHNVFMDDSDKLVPLISPKPFARGGQRRRGRQRPANLPGWPGTATGIHHPYQGTGRLFHSVQRCLPAPAFRR